MLMWVALEAAWGHVDVRSLCCLWELSLSSWFCSSWGPCWSPDLCCHWRLFGYLWSVLLPPLAPYWCTWPVLPWRPCCCRRLWCCLWSVLLSQWQVLMPETMQKSMIHAVALSKEQISYFVSDSNGCRCTVEKGGHGRHMWEYLLHSYPSDSNSLNRKPLKRIFKNYDRMPKCGTSQSKAFGRGAGGEELSYI